MQQTFGPFHSTLANLPHVAHAMLQCASQQRVWLFAGGMGAGKTTLIKALCAQLGVQDHVTSPTFSLINEYATVAGEAVYHFDFYRLGGEAEALDLDCAAYFEQGAYCFVEWPSKVPPLLPPVHCQVHQAAQPDGSRAVTVVLSV